jgi:hypothetical protein
VTRAAALAVAALAALALTGCGSAKDDRRDAVNDYLARVNQIQRELAGPWARARNAYAGVGRGTISERQLRTLAAAPRTIRSLRTRIAAVTPPADAKRLHASLLRLLDLNARFASEVEAFARYVRAVGPLEQVLGEETEELRRALKRTNATRAEQRALGVYASRLGALGARFRRLRPPPALAPWHAGQRARVATLRRAAGEVRDGLARRDDTLARRGLAALGRAAAASQVTTADRAAILAYGARLRRIRTATAAIAREQARLAQELR